MSEVAPKRRADPTRRRMVLAVVAVSLASLAFACAGIIGIDDRLPDEVADEGGMGFDRSVPGDAAVVPTTCTGGAKCVAVPEGWVLASLDPMDRPGCAPGYGMPEDVVVAADGLGCTCKCTETAPGSCAAAGAVAILRDYPAAGCGSSVAAYGLTVLDGGCANGAIMTTSDVRIPPATSAPPTCAADAGPSALRSGQTCTAQGATCEDGGTCAGALSGGARLCIRKDGDVACPPGFERKFNVGSSAGADTRKCGTCTCTPGQSCDGPQLDLFAGANCTSTDVKIPANGNCMTAEAGAMYASYRYTGKAPGCQPSVPPLLDGGVTIAAPRTLCCEQRN